MKVNNIIELLNLTVFNSGNADVNVVDGYTCDLLSDVMGNLNENSIWITLQTHRNVAAIASLKDAAAIILVKGLTPDENMLEAAKEEEIWVLGTPEEAFEISGKLYSLLNQ